MKTKTMQTRALLALMFLMAAPVWAHTPDASVAQTGGDEWISIEKSQWRAFAKSLRAQGQFDLLLQVDAAPVFREQEGVLITALTPSVRDALAQYMHVSAKRCGGYFAHADLPSAELFLEQSAAASALESLAVTYTVDQQSTVSPLLSQVSEANIRSSISTLLAYTNRWYNSSTGTQSANWIRDKWKALAESRSDVSVTTQACANCGVQPNVIASIPGSELPNEIVILGAHQDSTIGNTSNTSRAPGADDDASGVAVLTETLRVALANGFRPKRTVQFMAYAAEEVGLRGSKDLAASYRNSGKNVVGVLQLDMTNYRNARTTKDLWLMTDNSSSTLIQFLRDLFSAYMAPGGLTLGDTACGYACSDHASWTQNGFPAAMFSESKMGEHNPYIHTANDTLANSGGSASHSVHFGKLAVAFAYELGKVSGSNGPVVTPLPGSGVLSNLTLAAGEAKYFSYAPAANETASEFLTQNGSGDVELYVRGGAVPTTSSYDCKSDSGSVAETCVVNRAAGVNTFYLMLRGKTAVNGLTLVGRAKGVVENGLQSGVPVTGISLATNTSRAFFMNVPAGKSSLRVVTSGGTGDADLYVRFGSAPTTTVYDCKSDGATNSETCTINAPRAGTYHVLVNAYAAVSGLSLTATLQ